jgi:hypothetical protein
LRVEGVKGGIESVEIILGRARRQFQRRQICSGAGFVAQLISGG